ncbi:PadR family transcriptional regulator [Alkalicoccobacillus murimartini]|uniref:DNA-binding PadR family transcriptional regulator n=1 Tax=Alkalicoccobacillus murimartini TaxID=171685 RepID=A0ABT9YFR7_9BACI|nr:helix-turn-helix transcriptional regulator [Alkalicoccobacillus murimartini]MDQ0206531.1 DNA-binding PadR family transcriptional regulator [Alkalicoccobacillus murimartini]
MKRNKQLPLTETVYYILLSLLEPRHGYLIMQRVEELSEGQVRMAAGTLYGALDNLVKLHFIKPVPEQEGRRKVYLITQEGKDMLRLDQERMQSLLTITDQLLREDEHEEV